MLMADMDGLQPESYAQNWETRFGSNVRSLRQERGWTQEEFGKRLATAGFPMSQPIVANLESGKRPTRVAEVAAIAAVFSIPVALLFDYPDVAPAALELDRQVKALTEATWAYYRYLMNGVRDLETLEAKIQELETALPSARTDPDPTVRLTVTQAEAAIKFAHSVADKRIGEITPEGRLTVQGESNNG
jgi:transcriptional regulator with XRE-family HTH domain